jgi:hypothetical protein
MTDYSKIFPPIEPRVLAIGTPGCAKCRGLFAAGADDCVVTEEMSPFVGVPVGAFLCHWCFVDMNTEQEDVTLFPPGKGPKPQ